MKTELNEMAARRNRIFGMPTISLNISMNLPQLKQDVAESKIDAVSKLKAAMESRHDTQLADKLAEKLREKPLYTRGTSEHVGGG
jgi:hypothetical protein